MSLLVGLLLVGCSTDEPAPSSPACEMEFDISAVSRATTTFSNITARPFAIFGDMTPSHPEGTPPAPNILYNNTPVEYKGSAWVPASIQYWVDQHDHSFVAIHPADVLSGTATDVRYSASRLSFTYSIPSDRTKTVDILGATHRRRYTFQRQYDALGNPVGGGTAVVYLRFSHLLSQVNVAPALDDNLLGRDAYIEFHKLEITGFKEKGTFRIKPASLQSADRTDDSESDIEGRQGNGKVTIGFANPKKILNDRTNVNLLDAGDALIMLPQDFEAGSEAKMTLTYTVGSDPTQKQVTLRLENQKWESGKNHTYRFTIGSTGPQFETTTITDWDVLNVGDINAH